MTCHMDQPAAICAGPDTVGLCWTNQGRTAAEIHMTSCA
jgi:hypothetical protein